MIDITLYITLKRNALHINLCLFKILRAICGFVVYVLCENCMILCHLIVIYYLLKMEGLSGHLAK